MEMIKHIRRVDRIGPRRRPSEIPGTDNHKGPNIWNCPEIEMESKTRNLMRTYSIW